jgi:hypothetical protein
MKIRIPKILFVIGSLLSGYPSFAQEDLTALLGDVKEQPSPVSATFKTTRIVNGHSIEGVAKGVMDIKISHRFGRLNQGAVDLFGLDNAYIRIGADYGLTDNITIGMGRSSVDKEYDGYAKVKLLKQKDHGGSPIAISYVAAMSLKAFRTPVGETFVLADRICYTHQVLFAKKVNKAFSVQLTPTLVHYNLVDYSSYNNNLIAMGFGARMKVSNRSTINAEYYYVLNKWDNAQIPYTNNFSLGMDIETGGHVFQFMLTNTQAMTERNFIGQTTGQWGKGDIHLGFNLGRVFTVKQPKGFEGSRNSTY